MSLALALCACATSAPVREGTPKTLAVAIPTTCERVLVPVPLPEVDEHTDARIAFERSESAHITANERIDAGRGCIVRVRKSLAGEAKK